MKKKLAAPLVEKSEIRPADIKKSKPTVDWPSHTPFVQMISFCVRGSAHPAFPCPHCGDHIAETCELFLDDTDSHIWRKDPKNAGSSVRKILDRLEKRIDLENDLKAAESLYAIATIACKSVLNMYLRNRKLFDQISPRRNFLPALYSVHPNTAGVMAKMYADSNLGTKTPKAEVAGSRAYYVSDSPANVYARAILQCVSMNRELEPLSCQKWRWEQFDKNQSFQTVVLPFPKYVEGIDQLPPFSPATVIDYWHKGKEMIREEMPDFHMEPEWKPYHQRRYKTGSKTGAVQHAIFRDILAALRTIAGANHRQPNRRSTAKLVTK